MADDIDKILNIPIEGNKNLNSFIKKFWSARKLTQKNLLTESEVAFTKLADYARNNDLITEASIADAAVWELKGRYDEAIRCLEQVVRVSSCKALGIAYFMLGSVYKERHQNSLQEIIHYYDIALKDENFDKKAWAINNQANIYFRIANKDHIDGHKEDALKNYKKASALYKKSLKFNDEAQYITHYNQGRLHLALEEYADAIKMFILAISGAGDNLDLHASCFREMGTAHIINSLDNKSNTFNDALNCWKSACELFDEADVQAGEEKGKTGKSSVVFAKMRIAKQYRDKLDELKQEHNNNDNVLLRWWPLEESGSDGYSAPEERIFSMIEATGRDRYQLYNSRESSRFATKQKDNIETPAKDVLAILRGWGSASPLIEDAFSACVGGGYFLKWRDKGLVIDPGIDFMRNFRANGFHMREINGVVVSHDHTDHNADLRSLDDVFYEMYRRSDEDEPGDKERNWHYYLICDKQTKNKDFLEGDAKHRTKIGMDYGSFKNGKQEKKINLRDKGLPFIINYFKADHGIPAFCLRIDCLSQEGEIKAQIGFTCDTQYSDDLNKHFSNCNILVAHVSQPDLAELLGSNISKKKHLGYRGVSNLIKGIKSIRGKSPELTILGEFWAGFADMRIDITKGLKRICEDASIMPSSVGLFIHPNDNMPEVECSNCHKWRPASSIYVGAASHEFGSLAYLCPLCRI